MIKDTLKQEITEGSLVCYGVTSGDSLKIGIVTGVSSKKSKYSNSYHDTHWRRTQDLVQVTNLDKSKLENRWFVNHSGKFLALDENVMPFDVVESYYKLHSQLAEWTEKEKQTHDRDKHTEA